MTEPVAVFPSPKSGLGLHSWAREFATAARVTISPQDKPRGPLPRGDGRPVLLIPGFMSGDWSLIRLSAFLGALGYCPETARIWFNTGPTPALNSQLEARLMRLCTKGRVSLIGVSLGGVLARDLARRHPGAVRCVVTLCSPVHFPVTTPLEPFARLLAPFHDSEWIARRHQIREPLDVPVTAIHSLDDGIVDWQQCLIEESATARNVAVRGGHMSIASNPEAQAAVAFALAAA